MILSDAEKFALRQKISDYAKEIGFDLVGFSPAKIEEKYLTAFEEWIKEGHEGNMEYMKKIEQRRDLTRILPGAKSVIVFGMNYYHEQAPLKRGHGRVARYAFGRDYHKVIGKKLKMVEKFIAELCVDQSASTPLTKSYVDTGPILERALAEQAGIGRIGKNSLLITEKFGSWVFLSEIITTLDLNFATTSARVTAIPKSARADFLAEKTAMESHSDSREVSPVKLSSSASRWSTTTEKSFNVCGNCTRCMTACPTGAIIAPGVVDARLCISYLTIENKEKIPAKLAKIIKKTKRLYGCDICQEVCPHNRARQRSSEAKAEPNERSENLIPNSSISALHDGLFTPLAGDSLDIKKVLTKTCSSDDTFLKTFAGSPVMRTKRKGLARTAKIFNL